MKCAAVGALRGVAFRFAALRARVNHEREVERLLRFPFENLDLFADWPSSEIWKASTGKIRRRAIVFIEDAGRVH